jgi:hypothetical protein
VLLAYFTQKYMELLPQKEVKSRMEISLFLDFNSIDSGIDLKL